MSFINSDRAKMLAGKALLFPINHPKATLGLIGAAVLAKVMSELSTPINVGANLYSASQQSKHTELLNQLVAQGKPPEPVKINASQLLGG